VSNLTSAPSGNAAEHTVVLGDRVVAITGVTQQPDANQNFTVIDVTFAVTNPGDRAILNDAAFFRLLGSGGDAFAPRSHGADPFYDAIDARSTRTGSIGFEVPRAAASELRLLYRPEIATEAVIIPLSAG
jgi:hypothetical protein